MKGQRWDPSHQEKTQTTLRLEPVTTKRNFLPNTIKLGGNPMHTEPVLQLTRKVKRIRKRRGTIVFNYGYPQINLRMLYFLWSGKSMGNIMTNPWAIWMCTWLFGECSCTPLSWCINFYRQSIWREFIWIEEEIHQQSDNWLKYDWSPILYTDEESWEIVWWSKRPNMWIDRNSWSKNARNYSSENNRIPETFHGVQQVYCPKKLNG